MGSYGHTEVRQPCDQGLLRASARGHTATTMHSRWPGARKPCGALCRSSDGNLLYRRRSLLWRNQEIAAELTWQIGPAIGYPADARFAEGALPDRSPSALGRQAFATTGFTASSA